MRGKDMNIQFSPPDITEFEIQAVVEAMRSGWITTGPKTKLFEKQLADFFGTSVVVCVNSATVAMELILRALGVGPGDEVITSAYTYTASASVIHHVGAKIVLVDTAPESYFMDYQKLDDVITERTKVIIPVDLGGVMADYDRIFEIVKNKKNMFKPSSDIQKAYGRPIVLADAAHSIGASYRGNPSGSVGDFTAFSFHAVKNLTTAEGGAITWRDHDGIDSAQLYKQFQLLSLHGQNKDALSKMKLGSWEYDILYPGYKCNMTDLTAAFGLAQLERFPALMNRRLNIIRTYDEALQPLGIQSLKHFGDDYQGNGHLYLCRIPRINENDRNLIIMEMAEKGIACNVHFKPLPLFTAYKKLGFEIKNYPNAFEQYKNEITLPSHTLLNDEHIDFLLKTFLQILSRNTELNYTVMSN